MCGGRRGGENGEEIVQLLVVQPMKLGEGCREAGNPLFEECLLSVSA